MDLSVPIMPCEYLRWELLAGLNGLVVFLLKLPKKDSPWFKMQAGWNEHRATIFACDVAGKLHYVTLRYVTWH